MSNGHNDNADDEGVSGRLGGFEKEPTGGLEAVLGVVKHSTDVCRPTSIV